MEGQTDDRPTDITTNRGSDPKLKKNKKAIINLVRKSRRYENSYLIKETVVSKNLCNVYADNACTI